MKIKLIKQIKGKELVQELEEKYESIDKSKRAFKRDNENMKLDMDLGDGNTSLKTLKRKLNKLKSYLQRK